MKILFIGGTGNISLACAELLIERGHDMTLLNRGTRSTVDFPCDVIIADRNKPGELKKALEGKYFDVIADFICFDRAGAELAYEACKDTCGQYIMISTTVVYEKPAKKLPITEDTPYGNDFWPYGRLKEEAEKYLLEKHRDNNFPLTIVRPSHTYSKTWIPNMVSSSDYTIAARLEKGLPIFVPDDGQGMWTLTHVRDFAVGFAGLCGKQEAIGEAYHITSDMVLTWNQIIKEIAGALGVKEYEVHKIPSEFICQKAPELDGRIIGDKACSAVFDCAKIKEIVPDFDCTISFRQGIKESVKWFREDKSRQKINEESNQIFDKVINAWKNN